MGPKAKPKTTSKIPTLKPARLNSDPDQKDLSSSMDDFEDHYLKQNEVLAPKVGSCKEAQIGIHFIEQFLVNKLPSD